MRRAGMATHIAGTTRSARRLRLPMKSGFATACTRPPPRWLQDADLVVACRACSGAMAAVAAEKSARI